MTFKHACFDLHPTTTGPKPPNRASTVGKCRVGPSREDTAFVIAHAAQNIVSGFNDLMDLAIASSSLDEALAILVATKDVRTRVDAVADRAKQRMEELTR